MRHRKSFNHLSRKPAHRKAMLANMASSLILHKRISTTTAKAKALRMYVEPLITKAKDDSTHSRRMVFSYLQNKDAVTELFREVGAKSINRPGGYTRILKTGHRLGDNADMCIIELVDYNENLLAAKEEKQQKSSTRRSRRGGKKSKPTEETTQQTEQKVEAEVKAEENVEEVKDETEAAETEEKAETTKKEEKKEEPKEEEKKVEAKKEEKEEKKEQKSEVKKDKEE
ncbi:MAG: 50S ribosomal protein L17 [Thiohalospira sp.]